MRLVTIVLLQLTVLAIAPLASAADLTRQQLEPWSALEEQVSLEVKLDWVAMKKFIHPKGCFWGASTPHPVSMKTYAYHTTLVSGEDKVVAHRLIPVSVVVVGDVAIINSYLHLLTRPKEGKQVEKILRLHNTWKKEGDRWLLLATYNTVAKTGSDEK